MEEVEQLTNIETEIPSGAIDFVDRGEFLYNLTHLEIYEQLSDSERIVYLYGFDIDLF